MTRDEAKEAAKILEAYADGKTIEYNNPFRSDGWGTFAGEFVFYSCWRYRIKPEPREFWVADVDDDYRRVLLPGQKDLSADHTYIKVREVIDA